MIDTLAHHLATFKVQAGVLPDRIVMTPSVRRTFDRACLTASLLFRRDVGVNEFRGIPIEIRECQCPSLVFLELDSPRLIMNFDADAP